MNPEGDLRFLILSHIGDETALRVYAALRARHGAEHVKHVSAEEIVLAPYWAHREEDSLVTTEVRLSDGTSLDSANIGVVFNRLLALTLPQFAFAKAADRDYAIQEMNALCLSWLAGLPRPVINTPTPMGLSAPALSHAEWLFLAGKAELPVQGYHFTTDPRWRREKMYVPHRWRLDNPGYAFERISAPPMSRQPTFYLEPLLEQQESVIVAGNNVIGDLSGRYGEQIKYLAKIAGCDLLQVMFGYPRASKSGHAPDANWTVCGVNPFPHIHSAEAIEAIVQLLEAKRLESKPDSAVRE
jgi:hypothetical protein